MSDLRAHCVAIMILLANVVQSTACPFRAGCGCHIRKRAIIKRNITNKIIKQAAPQTNLFVVYPPHTALGSSLYAEGPGGAASLIAPEPPSLIAEKVYQLNVAQSKQTDRLHALLDRANEANNFAYSQYLEHQARQHRDSTRLAALQTLFPEPSSQNSGEAWRLEINSDGQFRVFRNGQEQGLNGGGTYGQVPSARPNPARPPTADTPSGQSGEILGQVIQEKCGQCHTGQAAKGGLQLLSDAGEPSFLDLSLDIWEKVMARIDHRDPSKLMPQNDAGIGVPLSPKDKLPFYGFYYALLQGQGGQP